MNKIVFIADFFADQVLGGGELNNEELINLLREDQFTLQKINSQAVDLNFLKENSTSFLIISNFVGLDYQCRGWIAKNSHYIIYEHDHKYLASRNPAVYTDFKAPETQLRNYSFYRNALAVICQSDFHKNIVEDNLDLDNIISVGGNLWSLNTLDKLRKFSKREKVSRCSILKSDIPHKNTKKAIKYCEANGEEYDLISDTKYIDFLDKLSRNDRLVFFPATPETLSRIVCEARMMGMSVITNDLVGATAEKWFKLKGESLIDYMSEKRLEIVNKIKELFQKTEKKIPTREVSIISTFHDGDVYLEEFLENITEQTVFDKCELIFIDAASEGNERSIIDTYRKKHDNIFYYRLEEKELPTPCLNLAIKKSKGRYITFGFIDDRRREDCLEVLLTAIKESDADLVYGDVLQTKVKNETFANNSADGSLFEHSRHEYSKENMIKCLPGPMPIWKSSIHDKCGFFDDENYNFADDWDMWLRAIDAGCVFERVNETVGLYLTGGRSQQSNNLDQAKEEAALFYKYKHIFGDNFMRYEPYFRQFLEL